MHIAEALLPLEEAVALARAALLEALTRNARYYARAPGLRPDPERPLRDRIHADQTWYFIPFARCDEAARPVVVRVNGVTKVVTIERVV